MSWCTTRPVSARRCARGDARAVDLSGQLENPGPGLRVGYLIVSPELFPYLLKLKQAADLHSNRLSQWLVLSQLQGDFAGHLARLRTLYRERRDQMHAALSEQLGEAANWQCPPGGLFWLQLNTPGIDTRTLLPEAMARGWLYAGRAVFPECAGGGGARCG